MLKFLMWVWSGSEKHELSQDKIGRLRNIISLSGQQKHISCVLTLCLIYIYICVWSGLEVVICNDGSIRWNRTPAAISEQASATSRESPEDKTFKKSSELKSFDIST
ncbi:hypothetical protein HID58_049613 [Brassica napus]|uniref:(rape) hypothetical protein n=1 Tax=Brassica napus TaxID=3708 RepID=A0A816K8B2_BRANA|nr:hypothetical protein HID58_049613 [Brassica napus]CAF1921052.1 unnamed protein product [Brassica napus]